MSLFTFRFENASLLVYALDASPNIQNHIRRKQIASLIYMYKPRCDHMPQISYAPNLVHKQDSQNLHSCIVQCS